MKTTHEWMLLYKQSFRKPGGLKYFYFCLLVQSNAKLRDSTPAQTPLLQRNGSGGGGQAAGQLGTGTSGAGSMGPSPHMMRKGKSVFLQRLSVIQVISGTKKQTGHGSNVFFRFGNISNLIINHFNHETLRLLIHNVTHHTLLLLLKPPHTHS